MNAGVVLSKKAMVSVLDLQLNVRRLIVMQRSFVCRESLAMKYHPVQSACTHQKLVQFHFLLINV